MRTETESKRKAGRWLRHARTETVKAFVYCSTASRNPTAIKAQKLACIDYCKREGLTVTKVFVDVGVAEPAIGPGLRSLIRACQAVGGNVRHLVLYPTDDSALIIRLLADALASPIIASGQPARAIAEGQE
jgi:hypothetical protein